MKKDPSKRFKINDRNAQPREKGKIPLGADNYKSNSDLTDHRFTIGHQFYNESLCEVKLLTHSPLRKVIENYKRLSKCSSVQDFRNTGITITDVNNSGHYSQYYSGLDPDVELKEFDAGKTERAFFFVDPAKKIIQVVALRNAHTETDKNRR